LSKVGLLSLCGFINTENHKDPYPDIEYHHNLFKKHDNIGIVSSHNIMGYNDEIIQSLAEAGEEAAILLVWVVLINPESRGKIVLNSADYKEKPKIYANYFDKKVDKEKLLKGIKFKSKFVNTKAFVDNDVELLKLNIPDCNKFDFQSDDYWECYIKFMTQTVYHPVGTVKMGPKKR